MGDFRFAARLMRRSPAFTLLVVGLLAVGIASLITEVLQAAMFLPGAIGRYRMVHSETGWKSRDVR